MQNGHIMCFYQVTYSAFLKRRYCYSFLFFPFFIYFSLHFFSFHLLLFLSFSFTFLFAFHLILFSLAVAPSYVNVLLQNQQRQRCFYKIATTMWPIGLAVGILVVALLSLDALLLRMYLQRGFHQRATASQHQRAFLASATAKFLCIRFSLVEVASLESISILRWANKLLLSN